MSAPGRILTLAGPGTEELVVKKSRFIARASPSESEEQAAAFIQNVRGGDKAASHHCFAWITGFKGEGIRFSDDGEPQGTAGLPILEALRKQGLTNCVCVVTRYFGGILLGAPGLTRAYAQAASMAVRAAGTAWLEESQAFSAHISYDRWDRVRHALARAGAADLETEFTDAVAFKAVLRATDVRDMVESISALTDGRAEVALSKPFYRAWTASAAE